MLERDGSSWATVRPRFRSTESSTSGMRSQPCGRNGRHIPKAQACCPQNASSPELPVDLKLHSRQQLRHLHVREGVLSHPGQGNLGGPVCKSHERNDHVSHMPVQEGPRLYFFDESVGRIRTYLLGRLPSLPQTLRP